MLHLRPLPPPSIIAFPNTVAETREAVVAQLENIQAALIARNGQHEGRLMFAEATVTAIARGATAAQKEIATLFALVEVFQAECGMASIFDETAIEAGAGA